jgi:hypothetical protein
MAVEGGLEALCLRGGRDVLGDAAVCMFWLGIRREFRSMSGEQAKFAVVNSRKLRRQGCEGGRR